MRRRSGWLPLLSLVLLAGCSGTNEVQQPVEGGQAYYFEVQYANWAWGHRLRGVVIDRDGNVTEWNRSGDPWEPQSQREWTTAQLEAKYNAEPKHLGTVPRDLLLEQIALIAAANEGEVTRPENRCADAGGSQFAALVYDAATDTYRNVLLRLEGDYYQENLSEAAQTLFAWLDELTEKRFANCGR